MAKDYQKSFKRIQQFENWDQAEELFNEVIQGAGLQDEETLKAQADFGRRVAEQMNARANMGKKI